MNLSDLLIGITAGLVAAFLTWFFLQVLHQMIVPWFEKFVYRGHIIEGEWKGYFLDKPDSHRPRNYNFTAYLKQHGDQIIGDLFLTKQPSGEKCEKHFDLQGNFREDDLILNFCAKDKSRFGRGTFTMQLMHDGELLQGIYTHFEAMHDKVSTDLTIWEKYISK